jgi:hypothetical protein
VQLINPESLASFSSNNANDTGNYTILKIGYFPIYKKIFKNNIGVRRSLILFYWRNDELKENSDKK